MAEPGRSTGGRRDARRRRDATWSLGLALAAAALTALGAPSCLQRRDDASSADADAEAARCASCHGDPQRSGDYLARAAPPRDLHGSSDSLFPGVGAHALHLNASSTHAAVACQECHVVPETVEAPGHDDDGRPAEITFGSLARAMNHQPSYDAEVETCTNSYCHGQARPLWTEANASPCGTCHGLPPAAPHPQSDKCASCHGDVIDEQRHFLHPERHVDGVVDYAAPSGCTSCHGSEQNAAPPSDIQGNLEITALGVGAHQAHLAGGKFGRPLECAECHTVPEKVTDEAHADASPAEVTLVGVAQTQAHAASWDRASATCTDSWCHGPSPGDARPSPVWNASHDIDCQSCHGAPPPAPHPQMSNCSHCHADVVGPDNTTIVDKNRHVDGIVDASFSQSCTSCHGDTNPAPPLDVEGESATSVAGVGAHQAHVIGSGRARAVKCAECHVVPDEVLAPGHVDSARPAELRFSGVAVAFGAAPVYSGGSCQMTSCHGGGFPAGHPSGGALTTPSWTIVDGSQAACGNCHALPPPAPHPLPSYPCSECHKNVAADGLSFTRPELHVDGVVTFQVP